MKPLQEYPHLFVENFSCRYKGKRYRIIGSDSAILLDNESSVHAAENPLEDSTRWVDAEDCTLIARPIIDISDKERGEFQEILKKSKFSGNPSDWHDSSLKSRLYLISIGVYPFDQSHFDDGTVIDSRI